MKKTGLLLALLAAMAASAQPKYEMRAVWVATVANIDWPSSSKLTSWQQRQEYTALLDSLQTCHINAVIVQIRPTADAFYPSSIEPWSRYLTGRQGTAPEPYYDPLEFFVAEAHRRCMEFHAWINPYRISNSSDVSDFGKNHFMFKNTDAVVKYGGKYYFNPGNPKSARHILAVVKEIVQKYDVDAIHMDDYFYPYPVSGAPFPDQKEYQAYGKKFASAADWRRSNVNDLIRDIARTIRAAKPQVKFGISPFGVWRNKKDDPRGSETQASITNYDSLYADVLLWLEKGWVDYVTPQLYWEIGAKNVDYSHLIEWWARNSYGRQVYVGHALYRLDEKAPTVCWKTPREIGRQIALTREDGRIYGSALYSARYLMANTLGVRDMLREGPYRYPALVPPCFDKSMKAPAQIQEMEAGAEDSITVKVVWKEPKRTPAAAYYLVYRFDELEEPDTDNPAAIMAKIPAGSYIYTDRLPCPGVYTYTVTAVSRNGIESNAAGFQTVRTSGEPFR